MIVELLDWLLLEVVLRLTFVAKGGMSEVAMNDATMTPTVLTPRYSNAQVLKNEVYEVRFCCPPLNRIPIPIPIPISISISLIMQTPNENDLSLLVGWMDRGCPPPSVRKTL
jgi:hypothetical protein